MSWMETLGLGSKRRSALRLLDAALAAGKVNPAYVDDGMRYVIYRWATEEETALGAGSGYMDRRMTEAAALMSFCVIGAADTESEFGADVRADRERRFEAALSAENDESFDARLVKLILAKGIAAADITARVDLV